MASDREPPRGDGHPDDGAAGDGKKRPSKRPTSNRKRGRPRKSESPFSPQVIEEVGRMYLQGVSLWSIALKFGVTVHAVEHHLNTKIKPAWRERVGNEAFIEMAKVNLLERIAYEQFARSKRKLTKETIKQELNAKALEDPEKATDPKIVERALQTIKRDGDATWLHIVQWCIDWRSKVGGHYAPERHVISGETELRVAGLSRDDLDHQMLNRLAELIAARTSKQPQGGKSNGKK